MAKLSVKRLFSKMAFSLPILVLLGGLTGCTSLHLHQAEDLEAAQKAQTAFEEARLKEVVVEERKLINEVLQTELETLRKNAIARRNQRLIHFIGNADNESAWKFLMTDITDRISELGLKDFDQFNKINIAKLAVADKRESLNRTLSIGPWKNNQVPNCDESTGTLKFPKNTQAPKSGTTEYIPYQSALTSCQKIKREWDSVSPDIKGIITNLDGTYKLESAIKAIELQIKTIASQVKRDEKAYKDSIEKNDPVLKITEAKNNFNASLNTLNLIIDADTAKSLKNSFPDQFNQIENEIKSLVLIEKLSKKEEQINAIFDAIIDAPEILDGDEETPNSKIKALGAIATAYKAIKKAENISDLNALFLNLEKIKIERKAAESKLANLKKRLQILKDNEQLRLEELRYLNDSYKELNGLVEKSADGGLKPTCDGSPNSKKLIKYIGAKVVDTQCQERAFRLFSNYAASWDFGRIPRLENDLRLVGLDHEGALDNTETSFAMWDNLLKIPFSQLVSLHETGITSEDISKLIQALGLSSIAVGVN